MEDFVEIIIFIAVLSYLVLSFWEIILCIILSGYLLISFVFAFPYYLKAYKEFLKKRIKNSRIREKTFIDFVKINQNMFDELFKFNFKDKVILYPGILFWNGFHFITALLFYLPYRTIHFFIYYLISKSDKKYLKNRFAVCKYCYKMSDIPLYRCSKCNRLHSDLYPSLEFGTFYHICKCGAKLPVYKNKREQLQAVCSFCKNDLISEYSVLTKKKLIVFIGNDNAGKTTYVTKILDVILKNYPAEFIDNRDKFLFNSNLIKINNSLPLDKTLNIELYNLLINQTLLYFFDIPGNVIENVENLINYDFISNSLIVFVINSHEIKYFKKKHHYKSKPLTDTISRIAEILQRQLNLPMKKKIDIPLSVVVNEIGTVKMNDIEKDLIELGEESFVQFLRVKFNNVKYYSFNLKNDSKNILKPLNLREKF